MKKNFYRLSIILFIVITHQSLSGKAFLSIVNVNWSNYPQMSCDFYLVDSTGKLITDLNPGDIKLTENDAEFPVSGITCQPNQNLRPASIAMSFDVSGSMTENIIGSESSMDFAKISATTLINSLILPPAEVAIQTCNDVPKLLTDYTFDKSKLLTLLKPIDALGLNDFYRQLLDPDLGLINLAKRGRNDFKAAIIFSDSFGDSLFAYQLKNCIDTLKKYNITFYNINYSNPLDMPDGIKASFREMADATGGRHYEGVLSDAAAQDLAYQIELSEQGLKPCHLTWTSAGCFQSRKLVISVPSYNMQATESYIIPINLMSNIVFTPNASIRFGEVDSGTVTDKQITITAARQDINIDSIIINNGKFHIKDFGGTPPPFKLANGESRTLTLEFNQTDSDYAYAKFEIISDACQKANFYATGGYMVGHPRKPTLHLVKPNGGEIFVAGCDTTISWEGVLPTDKVRLTYSLDSGKSWSPVTDTSSGLIYRWMGLPLKASNQCLAKVILPSQADNPKWVRQAGGILANSGTGICTDFFGNIYVTGYYVDSASFGNGINLFDKDYTSSFIAKYNSLGVCQYAIGATSNSSVTTDNICSDSSGSIYVAYHFSGNMKINDSVFTSKSTSAILLAKIGWDGKFDWMKQYDVRGIIKAMAVDNNSNIFLTGQFNDSISFGNFKIARTQSLNTTFYVAKIGADGNCQWIRAANSSSSGTSYGNSLNADSKGNIYATGRITGNTFIGDSIFIGFSGPFIVKFNADGSSGWVKTIDQGTYPNNSTEGISVACADSSLVYLLLNPSGFINKYDNNGNFVGQARITQTSNLFAHAIVNSRGEVYFSGAITRSSGNSDFFIAKFDSTGEIIWYQTGGGNENDAGNAISVDYLGNVYTTGYFCATSDFGNNIVLMAKGQSDAFIMKLTDVVVYEEDRSDSVWSIILPDIKARDIDFGTVYVGYPKDTTLTDFVQNQINFPVKVDGISITGFNQSDFKPVSLYPPYTLEPIEKKKLEMVFNPTFAGSKTATLTINTKAAKFQYNLTGRALSPPFSLLTKQIDFGGVLIGDKRDTTLAVITNLSYNVVSVSSTEITGADGTNFRIISGGGPFTLDTLGAQQVMTLEFLPTEEKLYNAGLQFTLDTNLPRPEVQLLGEGIHSTRTATMQIPNIEAQAGDVIEVPVILKNLNNFDDWQKISFIMDLKYNSTLMAPYNPVTPFDISGGLGFVHLTGNADTTVSDTIAKIKMWVTLGNDVSTIMNIDNPISIGGKVEIITIPGILTITNICNSGGTRLVGDSGTLSMTQNIPNPADDEAYLKYSLIEEGNIDLSLYNIYGKKILIIDNGIKSSGIYSKIINTKNLAAGSYIYILKTPSSVLSQKMEIIH